MIEARRLLLLGVLKVADLFLLCLSFAFATIVVVHASHRVTLSEFLGMRVKLGNCAIFLLMLVVWHGLFTFAGLYRSKRLSTHRREIIDVTKACALAAISLSLVSILFSVEMASIRFLISFWAINTALMTASRMVLRFVAESIRRRGHNLRHMIILGTNPRAVEFARRIESRPERGYRLLGFVDEDWAGLAEFKKTGYPLVSRYHHLAEYLRRNVVDEVAMYLPLRSFHEYSSVVASLCQQHGIIMRFDSDIFGVQSLPTKAEEVDGKHYLSTDAHDLWPLVAKRSLDILFSVILLLLLSPLMIAVGLLIKVCTNGPVFFRQERVGLNKRRFSIYKFCTMVPNAEKLMAQLEQYNEAKGPVFKIKEDPRITPIGKFLRRTSIDELPQLLNVLHGDMSLVGPRPLPVRDYERFNEDWQRRRFSVRPGITCLWQVNGRSSITFDQWMKLDIQYLDEWSFWLDVKILARTIPAVLKGSGAA